MTRRILHTIAGALVALVFSLGATPAFAQHLATATTLSAAADNAQGTIVVASATSFAANAYVWIDFELMQVRPSYSSGTTIPVRRGANGTAARAHNSAARVIVNLDTGAYTHFYAFDPDVNASCTAGVGQARVSPWINFQSGWVFVCRANGSWVGTYKTALIYNSEPVFTP